MPLVLRLGLKVGARASLKYGCCFDRVGENKKMCAVGSICPWFEGERG